MKKLKSFGSNHIYEYNEEAKRFCKFLNIYFKNKHNCGYSISEDDGSYKSSTGVYIQFDNDNYYISAHDLLNLWKDGLLQWKA